jgi:biopolymer transport protein ExbD
MFRSVQSREQASGVLVDIAPLIDVMFILLLFFLVSSTFVRDTGVAVTRPQATLAQALEPTSMRVSVTAAGDIYAEGARVSLDELRSKVSSFVAREKRRTVIVIPDEAVPSGRLVEVMDAARLGGADDVAVATARKEGGR